MQQNTQYLRMIPMLLTIENEVDSKRWSMRLTGYTHWDMDEATQHALTVPVKMSP